MADTVWSDGFSGGLENWWVEGGQQVQAKDGVLDVRADPPDNDPGGVCTVWCRQPFGGDLRVEFDARVKHSHIGANNLNFFLHYSDPCGADLYDTREARADGGYAKYHQLTGYIFTFLNDRHGEADPAPDGLPAGRMRIRRCPGFRLLAENYGYHCRAGRTYRITVEKRGGVLRFDVDGEVSLEGGDPEPLGAGYLGFRTFRTHVEWGNLRVRALEETS